MEPNRPVPIDVPGTYRICITGNLENELAERLWGMISSPVEEIEEEQTVLVGGVADQAALVGIINALYNAGHTVISVERLSQGAVSPRYDAKENS